MLILTPICSYIPYIDSFTHNLKLVHQLENDNANFKTFLLEQVRDPVCNGLSFSSYLIMPVQRLPRYTLLLSEIKKNTPTDHSDFNLITSAIDEMQKVTCIVDHSIKIKEDNLQLLELSWKIKGVDDLFQVTEMRISLELLNCCMS